MSDAGASPWEAGRRAVGEVALPAAVILSAALALVLCYYRLPSVQAALDAVGKVRAASPLTFAALCTAVTAGLIPWLVRLVSPALRPRYPWRDLLHSVVWWALMGVVVDRFYVLLGLLLGPVPSPGVVAGKVVLDMFVFTPLIGALGNALSHLWKDLGWDRAALRAQLGPGWYRRLVVPNLLPNWAVWGPGTAIFYSLPMDLQLPVANAIGCCWALLCVRIAAHTRPVS